MTLMAGAAVTLPMAPIAVAQDIHICVDAAGARSYQSTPCAAGQRTQAIRAYPVAPVDATLAARTAAVQREMDQRNRGGGRTTRATARAPRGAAAGATPCQTAKARRQAALDRAGLKRDFTLLSRVDAEVWNACKGL